MDQKIIDKRNSYVVHSNGTATLTVKRRSGEAVKVILDAQLVPWAKHTSWHIGTGRNYATCQNPDCVPMARLILHAEGDERCVIYKNGDTLDNQRNNLTLGSRREVSENYWQNVNVIYV